MHIPVVHRVVAGSAALILTALSILPACAETTMERIIREKTVRVGFYNGAPWNYADSSGKLTGANVEVFRAVMAKVGVENLEGVLGEFSSLIPGLVANRFDAMAVGAYVRPERCERVAFGNPDYQQGVGFAVKAGNPKNLRSYDDVKAAGAMFGSSSGGAEAEFARIAGIADDHIVGFPDAATGIAALQAGRIDVLAFTPLELRDILKKTGDTNLEYADLTSQPLDANGKPSISYGATAFRLEDKDLVDAYNKGLAELFASGEWLKIVEPFGLTEADMPNPDVTSKQLCKG